MNGFSSHGDHLCVEDLRMAAVTHYFYKIYLKIGKKNKKKGGGRGGGGGKCQAFIAALAIT